jgi:LysM repeat protein
MDPARRRELTRYGAPALFLVAVTVAVLLVKSGLNSGSSSQAETTTVPTSTERTTTQATTTTKLVLTTPTTATTATTTTTTATTTPGAQYYVIQTGDTLGAIAAKYNTTVQQLLTLNPDVNPSALQPGARIRVG